MIYTKPEEIALVKDNLEIFEDRFPNNLRQRLLTRRLRINQYSLFYSLCDPHIYPFLLSAIDIIKQIDKAKYLPKAIKKLVQAKFSIDQRAVVAEIIAVAYYLNKFSDSSDVCVEWERKLPNSTKVMDISLLGQFTPINIEVTAKDRDSNQRNHLELRYRVKVAIEQAIEKITHPKYSYIFSLRSKDVDGTTITDFSDQHTENFVNFILESRKHGEGEYEFGVGGEVLASVIISKLNKAKFEYATDLDMWTGFLNDEKRIRNRIVDKAKDQLPEDEINFVFVPNTGGFDEIDYQEAFLGKEQWHIGKKSGDIVGVARKPDGAIQVIASEDYSPVAGLIWSGFDYSKKKFLQNPSEEVDEKVIELIK